MSTEGSQPTDSGVSDMMNSYKTAHNWEEMQRISHSPTMLGGFDRIHSQVNEEDPGVQIISEWTEPSVMAPQLHSLSQPATVGGGLDSTQGEVHQDDPIQQILLEWTNPPDMTPLFHHTQSDSSYDYPQIQSVSQPATVVGGFDSTQGEVHKHDPGLGMIDHYFADTAEELNTKSELQVQMGNFVDDSNTMPSFQGDSEGNFTRHSLQGDIHGMEVQKAEQGNEALNRLEGEQFADMEANVALQSYVDKSNDQYVAVQDTQHQPNGSSMALSSLETESNVDLTSRISRTRHPDQDIVKLRNYFDSESPYPTLLDLFRYSRETSLDFKQIGTFFSNERARRKKNGNTSNIVFKERKRHSDVQKAVLEEWVAANDSEDPRPTKKERMELAEKTELTLEQVSDWFANLRKKRKLQRKSVKDHDRIE